VELASSLQTSAPFARVWMRAEVEWQCGGRSGAITSVLSENGRRGVLTGYAMEVNGAPADARVAIVEDLLWGDLDDAQQSALLKRLMQTAAARGCHTASCPILGYTSLEPLVNAGFGRGNRIVHAYLTLWNGPHPEPISSLYIDVF